MKNLECAEMHGTASWKFPDWNSAGLWEMKSEALSFPSTDMFQFIQTYQEQKQLKSNSLCSWVQDLQLITRHYKTQTWYWKSIPKYQSSIHRSNYNSFVQSHEERDNHEKIKGRVSSEENENNSQSRIYSIWKQNGMRINQNHLNKPTVYSRLYSNSPRTK